MTHKSYCSVADLGVCSCNAQDILDAARYALVTKRMSGKSAVAAWMGGLGAAPPEPAPAMKELSLDEAVSALIECQSGSFQGMVENLRKKGIRLCRAG